MREVQNNDGVMSKMRQLLACSVLFCSAARRSRKIIAFHCSYSRWLNSKVEVRFLQLNWIS